MTGYKRFLTGALCFMASIVFAGGTESSPDSTGWVGFKRFQLSDEGEDSRNRDLSVAVWYPVDSQGGTESIGENGAFYGIEAVPEGRPADGEHPLVLLSHGYGGHWRSLNWLAGTLASKGYIVAAPDHPGTSTFNHDAQQASRLWLRPHDLSQVMDALLNHPEYAGDVDDKQIAAIGHSLGGWTVMALAGGHFDNQWFRSQCQLHPNPRVCGLSQELGLNQKDSGAFWRPDQVQDDRIKAVVSLDLGMARGFTPDSLKSISVPVLLLAAGVDIGDLPAEMESGYLASFLPPSLVDYEVIPDAMHFSFMPVCKDGAIRLIEAESPGDGIVCRDGGERSRDAIHAQVSAKVLNFLSSSM